MPIIKSKNEENEKSISSCDTFDDSKENIKEETSILLSDIDISPMIKPKNEKNERSPLKNISNKPCNKKQALYLGHQKDRIFQKLQYKQPTEVAIFKHSSNINLAAHKIDKISYCLLNSCPFDSLVQALFVIGTDDELMKKTVSKNIF